MSFAPSLGAAHFSKTALICATLIRHFFFRFPLARPVIPLPIRMKSGALAGLLILRVGSAPPRPTPVLRTGLAAVRVPPVALAADDLQPPTADAGKLSRVRVGLLTDWVPEGLCTEFDSNRPACELPIGTHRSTGVCERPGIAVKFLSPALLFAWADSRLRPLGPASNKSTRGGGRALHCLRPSRDLARTPVTGFPPSRAKLCGCQRSLTIGVHQSGAGSKSGGG